MLRRMRYLEQQDRDGSNHRTGNADDRKQAAAAATAPSGGSRGSVSPTAAEAHAPTHMGSGTAVEAAEAAGTTGPTRAAGASSSTGSASKAAPTAAGMSSRTWHIHSSSFYG